MWVTQTHTVGGIGSVSCEILWEKEINKDDRACAPKPPGFISPAWPGFSKTAAVFTVTGATDAQGRVQYTACLIAIAFVAIYIKQIIPPTHYISNLFELMGLKKWQTRVVSTTMIPTLFFNNNSSNNICNNWY